MTSSVVRKIPPMGISSFALAGSFWLLSCTQLPMTTSQCFFTLQIRVQHEVHFRLCHKSDFSCFFVVPGLFIIVQDNNIGNCSCVTQDTATATSVKQVLFVAFKHTVIGLKAQCVLCCKAICEMFWVTKLSVVD